MFLKDTLLSGSVPSGSTSTGELNDISSWKKYQIMAKATGGIAGTGSFFVGSVSQGDTDPTGGINDLPDGSALMASVVLAMPDGVWVSSSVSDVSAKWGIFQFTSTSGSTNTTTGSVIVKGSFNNW